MMNGTKYAVEDGLLNVSHLRNGEFLTRKAEQAGFIHLKGHAHGPLGWH